MTSPYRVVQDAIKAIGTRPSTDTAVLAWALARVLDRRVWEVRVARYGVCIYPVGAQPDRVGMTD